MEVVKTKKAPQPVGPYHQAIIANGFIFTAGQIAIDPSTGRVHADAPIAEQTEWVLKNLGAVLTAADSGLDMVIKTTVFLADMNDFAAMNEVYSTFFQEPYPARSAVEVAALPKGVKVEIECVAQR
jgi:2-iminobutanoate/2-iminopropanoate deaminase